MGLVQDAIDRHDAVPVKRVDYDELNRVVRAQRSALTRAVKTGDTEKVAETIKAHIAKWDEIGMWPDDWSHWDRAINDMLPWNQQINIEDL